MALPGHKRLSGWLRAINRCDGRIVAWLCTLHRRRAGFDRLAAFFARRGPLLFFGEMALILVVRRVSSPGQGVQDALRGVTVAVTAAVCAKMVIDPIARRVHRRRPFVVTSSAPLIEKDPGDPSFPSNHAGGAFALATVIALYFPHWAAVSWALAIVLSCARVYAGVHYPSDIAAGAAIGALCGIVFSLVLGF